MRGPCRPGRDPPLYIRRTPAEVLADPCRRLARLGARAEAVEAPIPARGHVCPGVTHDASTRHATTRGFDPARLPPGVPEDPRIHVPRPKVRIELVPPAGAGL